MDRFLNDGLLEGEKILWEGKSEPFRILSGPYARRIPLLWTISGILLFTFAALYFPYALRTQSEPMQILFACVMVGIIPVSLCVYSIKDPWDIRKNLQYVLTNYRAVTINKRGYYPMMLDEYTPWRSETFEDGTEVLYLGDACRVKPSSGREKTVLGIRGDETDPRRVTGLVFYGVKDAEKICEANSFLRQKGKYTIIN